MARNIMKKDVPVEFLIYSSLSQLFELKNIHKGGLIFKVDERIVKW